jgi:hypothetical protein
MTMTQDRELMEALEQVRIALAAMASGNPEPYIDAWADIEDVTLFGAWGRSNMAVSSSSIPSAGWAAASPAGRSPRRTRSCTRAAT